MFHDNAKLPSQFLYERIWAKFHFWLKNLEKNERSVVTDESVISAMQGCVEKPRGVTGLAIEAPYEGVGGNEGLPELKPRGMLPPKIRMN